MAPKACNTPSARTIQALQRKITRLNLDEKALQAFKTEMRDVIPEAERLYQEALDNYDQEVVRHHEMLKVNCPPDLRKLTIGEIRAAGGSFSYDPVTNQVVINIPSSCRTNGATPLKSAKKIGPRAIEEAIQMSQKVKDSLRRSKRLRELEATTPNIPASKKKNATSSANKTFARGSVCTSIQRSVMVSNFSVRSKLSVKKKHIVVKGKKTGSVKAQKVLPSSPLTDESVSPIKPCESFNAVELIEPIETLESIEQNVPAELDEPAEPIEDTVESEQNETVTAESDYETGQESMKEVPREWQVNEEQVDPETGIIPVRLTLFNPRTPSGNRLFNKNPRVANPDERVVHCSITGTPLIVLNPSSCQQTVVNGGEKC